MRFGYRWLVGLASMLVLLTGAAPAGAEDPLPPPFIGQMLNVGSQTFEPTIGADPAGNLFYSVTPGAGPVIGFKAGTFKSTNAGATWSDITPTLNGQRVLPVETNDPYIYVDPSTGRVFQFHMSPILTCSILSFSDNQGASWTTNPLGCGPTGAWDHQTIVAAKPRDLPTVGYPNVVVQCVNAVYAEMCSRSLNGGLTWSPSTPAYVNTYATSLCGTQTGHLVAAPDGTIYLPTSTCGDRPTVYISKDDSLTWTKSVIADMDTPFVDPSVTIDSLGTVYATFIDETGNLYYSVSRDTGTTWSTPVQVAAGTTNNMPVITVGDPGKVFIASFATDDLAEGYGSTATKNTIWSAFLSVSYNGLDAAPTFVTTEANGADPLVRGQACTASTRCAYEVDFIEAVIAPDGRPYAAYVDGCTGSCALTTGKTNDNVTNGQGVVATFSSMPAPLCETRCATYGPAPGGAT
jgi:hypothetical protein